MVESTIPEGYVKHLPLKALLKMSFLLNPLHPGRDWKSLAAELNYTLEEVRSFECALDPTMELLKQWDVKEIKPLTVPCLIQCLKTIKRMDAIQDLIEETQNMPTMFDRNTFLQEHGMQIDNINNVTMLDDYDVFIAYAKEDIDFAKNVVHNLENKPHCFNVCIDFRDFIPGYNSLEQIVDVIESKCRKVIVVLSPSFNESDDCDYQAKVALSLSPGAKRHKVIPILVEKCKPPSILRSLTYLDYTDPDHRQFFWQRLSRAISVRRR